MLKKQTSKEKLFNKLSDQINNVFEKVIDNGIFYEDSLENMDYCSLFYKAANDNFDMKLVNGMNLCGYRYMFKEKDSVLFVFWVPINDERNYRSKYISEKVMEVIKIMEDLFITLDYIDCDELKDDKFVYLTVIKS